MSTFLHTGEAYWHRTLGKPVIYAGNGFAVAVGYHTERHHVVGADLEPMVRGVHYDSATRLADALLNASQALEQRWSNLADSLGSDPDVDESYVAGHKHALKFFTEKVSEFYRKAMEEAAS